MATRKTGTRRQRGVRASPAELHKALGESGLKTRIAVAERIADMEGIDSVPSGIVNRAFRGEPVDPGSLERIAQALGVAAATLYASETDNLANSSEARDTPRTRRNTWIAPAGILAALVLFLVMYVEQRSDPAPDADAPKPRSLQPTAIVLSSADPEFGELTDSLVEAVNEKWRVLPGADPTSSPQSLIVNPAIDRVVEVVGRRDGRFLDVQVHVHDTDAMHVAWRGSLRLPLDASVTTRRMLEAANAIHSEETAAVEVLPAQAMTRYLAARESLDQVRTELNLRRALTDLESAIRFAPLFADAHAGLCEALVLDNVRTGNPDRLAEAERACRRALEIAPQNVEALRAQAYLDRKRGRLEAAISGFETVLQTAPSNTDAWLGLAEAHLTQFGRNNDIAELDRALLAVEQAIDLEPGFWKTFFTLARVRYFGGQLDSAIDAAGRAARLDPNVLTLSNLGSFQYCAGDLNASREAYERARELDPTAFVGEAQLGVVYYFARDYSRAIGSFESALALYEAAGEAQDHRLWGNYAHALRQAERREDAIRAYGRAITLAEAAVAKGDGRAYHAVYLAYYYEMLSRLDPQHDLRVPTEQLSDLMGTTDPIAQLYLAIILGLRGDKEASAGLALKGAQGCPGFARAPDLDFLSM